MSNQTLWAGCDLSPVSTGPGFSFFSSLPIVESNVVLSRLRCFRSEGPILKVLHGLNRGANRHERSDLPGCQLSGARPAQLLQAEGKSQYGHSLMALVLSSACGLAT